MAGHRVGWAKREFEIEPRGLAMNGYGMWTHRATGARTPLFARALYIAPAEGGRPVIFCLLDLGMVSHAIRSTAVAALRAELGDEFWDEGFVLMCTHTHSAPGGCTWDALYNVVTPGFIPDHLEKVVRATVDAVTEARRTADAGDLGFVRGALADSVPVAWNRSLSAYNRNPEIAPQSEETTHLALDRSMGVVTVRREGELRSLLSWFGVHGTCLGNTLDQHDGDNKGYAAAHAEAALGPVDGVEPVAIFAQATAGDVSPHFHGPGAAARRAAMTPDGEVRYARRNGEYQSEHALAIASSPAERPLTGELDAALTYVDFSCQRADPEFADGTPDATTVDACHGVAFFRGTPIDGPGAPAALGRIVTGVAAGIRRWRLSADNRLDPDARAYYRRLYAAQDPKAILLEAGRKQLLGRPLTHIPLPDTVDPGIAELKRQARAGAIDTSDMVPSVLPVQIVRIGSLAVVCCPGEFTTVAGGRVVDTVAASLADAGVDEVVIATYANDYMGYVTTQQEYDEQNYEGGHTVYGRWTLAAFQTVFRDLADQLGRPAHERIYDRTTRPPAPVLEELAKRTG